MVCLVFTFLFLLLPKKNELNVQYTAHPWNNSQKHNNTIFKYETEKQIFAPYKSK